MGQALSALTLQTRLIKQCTTAHLEVELWKVTKQTQTDLAQIWPGMKRISAQGNKIRRHAGPLHQSIFSSIFSCNSQEIRFSGEAFIGIKCSLFSSMVPQDSLWTLFIPVDLLGYFSWHPNTLRKRPSILANDPWDPWPKSHCLSRDDMSLSSRSLQWWMWCSVVSTNFSRKASMIISVQAPVILPSCVCLNNELYLSRFFSGAQKATCTLHTTEHGPHSRCWLPRLVAWKVIRNNGTIQILIIK